MSEEHLTPCFSTPLGWISKKKTDTYLVDRRPFFRVLTPIIISSANLNNYFDLSNLP